MFRVTVTTKFGDFPSYFQKIILGKPSITSVNQSVLICTSIEGINIILCFLNVTMAFFKYSLLKHIMICAMIILSRPGVVMGLGR